MKKLVLLALVCPSISFALITDSYVSATAGCGSFGREIPLQGNYKFTVKNTSDVEQEWYYKASLCAQDHRCEIHESHFKVPPFQTREKEQTIYNHVKYPTCGGYFLTSSLHVWQIGGESKEISKKAIIYVNN